MFDYEFEMPWPPSVNGGYRAIIRNRIMLSKRGREYRVKAMDALSDMGLFGESVSDRLSVSLILHPPTLRKYDIDNFNKALFDALTHAEFWEDDELIDKLSIVKGEKVKGGKIIVKVKALKEDQ